MVQCESDQLMVCVRRDPSFANLKSASFSVRRECEVPFYTREKERVIDTNTFELKHQIVD